MGTSDLFIFLHIPRTGGTTLNSIFFNNFAKEEIVSLYSREDFTKGAEELSRRGEAIRLVQGHFLHDEGIETLRQGRDAKVITFVRHPVERLVSEYLFLKNWPHSQMYEVLNSRGIGFAEYITSEDKAFRWRTKNLLTRVFSRMSFEADPPPEAEDAALAQARTYALTGIVEQFDAGLLLLADLMGLKDIHYERKNRVAPGLKESVRPEDKALAAQYNAADIRLYERLKDDFAQKLAGLPPAFHRRVKDFSLINDKFNKVADLINKSEGLDKEDIVNPKQLWDYV